MPDDGIPTTAVSSAALIPSLAFEDIGMVYFDLFVIQSTKTVGEVKEE